MNDEKSPISAMLDTYSNSGDNSSSSIGDSSSSSSSTSKNGVEVIITCGTCQIDVVEEETSFFVKKGEMLVIGNENVNLQDSFKKFRNQKLKERQILKQCKVEISQGKRSDIYKNALRQKFIDGCKKYLGVPYAERFKAPEAEIAPLYLDCCGLVRQVVQDLQEDFGFVIGKWNQCYQMDTLPIKLERHQLKPGDLIFYEGIYNSNRSKPQKHNNVHVEVYLGGETGDGTIGSRYHKGCVSIFPSFEFKSTTWDLVQYHFRSLDSWLDGACVSCCDEHPWLSDSLSIMAAAGKRSIFNDDDEDVSAGGLDEDTNESNAEENCNVPAVDDVNPAVDSINTDPVSIGNIDATSADNANVSISGQSIELSTPSSRLSSSPARMKPRASNKINASKVRRSVSTSLDSIDSLAKINPPHTYYVSKSNGWKLVKEAMDKRGWQQLPFEYQFSSRFGLKWVERRSQIDYRAHTPGQLVNHIPNNDFITTKLGLLNALRDTFCKQSSGAANLHVHAPWVPESYRLDVSSDVSALLAAECKLVDENGKGGVWIYKPSCNNRGRGIKVFAGKDMLDEICNGKNTGNPETTIAPLKGLVQRYIEQPMLIGAEGYKFDLRCYLLVARNDPSYLAFYHPGYCRMTLKPYSCTLDNLHDTTIHLTNASIQKKDPLVSWTYIIHHTSSVL